jgi:pentose-5-phosphate-3-epimerase
MMCANYDALKIEVELLDQAGADIFHIDITNQILNFENLLLLYIK